MGCSICSKSNDSSDIGKQQQISKEDYLKTFGGHAAHLGIKNVSRSVVHESGHRTRALFCDFNQQKPLQLSNIAFLADPKTQEDVAVIIVENIDLDWISTLGTTLEIDVAFFCKHADGLKGSSPWKAIFSSSPAGHKRPTQSTQNVSDTQNHVNDGVESTKPLDFYWHVDGVFDLGQSGQNHSYLRNPNFILRTLKYEVQYGWQAATRISYCQVKQNLRQYKDACKRKTSRHILISASRSLSGRCTHYGFPLQPIAVLYIDGKTASSGIQ